jgi:tetratricopeptide (TPR) repeat protein
MDKGRRRIFSATAAVLFLFASCQSLRKDFAIPAATEAGETDMAILEEMIVALDTDFSPEKAAASRAKLAEMGKRAAADTDYAGRLAAWSGRLFLLEGKNADARKQLSVSRDLSPGNVPSLVLAARLEEDMQRRLALIDGELKLDPALGELQLERGRTLVELRRFGEAVAAFDTAFPALPAFYRNGYGAVRDRAWELRNTGSGASGRTMAIVEQGYLNWGDLIEITAAETDMLRFLTAGRNWPPREIFDRLLERSFIPAVQNVAQEDWSGLRPRIDEKVLRSGAAWYLWRLHAENRADRGLLSRYSSRYGAMKNPRSPVADLPLLSPFFDSILGCVESEYMTLPDGRNFAPAEQIRGAEFLTMLKKLK